MCACADGDAPDPAASGANAQSDQPEAASDVSDILDVVATPVYFDTVPEAEVPVPRDTSVEGQRAHARDRLSRHAQIASDIVRAKVSDATSIVYEESVNGGPPEPLEYQVLASSVVEHFKGTAAVTSIRYFVSDLGLPDGDVVLFLVRDGIGTFSLLDFATVQDESFSFAPMSWSLADLRQLVADEPDSQEGV